MNKEYFSFSDGTHKIRSKFLGLSGVSLFIGITEELPKKVSFIGLDLSNNQKTLGWFLFFVTLMFLFNFLIVAILELIEYYLPSLIKKEINKTTGDTLGLTIEECMQHDLCNHEQFEKIGTKEKELEEINIKNLFITSNYKSLYTKSHDFAVIMFNFVFPVILSVFGVCYLFKYLSQT